MFQGCTREVQDHRDSDDGLMAGLHDLSFSNEQCKEKVGIEALLCILNGKTQLHTSYCSAISFCVFIEWKFCHCIQLAL